MKDLIKQYLDRGISRRNFLSGLGAIGFTTAAANSMARSLAPFVPPAESPTPDNTPPWMREMRGRGAVLMVAQLKAAGIEHIFFNPGGEAAAIYDALVDEPSIQLIEALHESSLAAMADGYAKASHKTPFVIVARPGFPNTMSQLFNTWKAQIPMVVAIGFNTRESLGEDAYEDADHMEGMAQSITKWYWLGEMTEKIPEMIRRGLKFASTSPCGPVFLAFPADTLIQEGKALIMDQAKFTVPMKIRPDPALVEKTARLLLESKNPLLLVGDEVVWCGAQKEVTELAELLGLPVTRNPWYVGWSKPFPTYHPLYLDSFLPEMRYPGAVDLILNLGSRMPFLLPGMSSGSTNDKMKLIEVRLDPTNMARVYPTDVPMVADVKLATTDLLDAIRSMATAARLKQIRESRTAKTREYTTKRRSFLQSIARNRWGDSPMSAERMAMELEEILDKDTCFVFEVSSSDRMENLMSFGGADKQFFTRPGGALGWGLPASFGVKLAHPDLPVVAVVGDGSFLFSGPQPLWSFARYRAPVTICVVNNRSYNAIRTYAWLTGGRQFQTGQDMAAYLGDPDMDFVKMASSFGVEGETVADPSSFRAAMGRAKRANIEGRPYLLDVFVERDGLGAASTWHPSYSIAALRKRKV